MDNIYTKCNLLQSLNVKRSTALILSALSSHKELTSNDIQNMLKMSQSEVSIIINNLTEKGFVTYKKTKEKSTKKVRAYYLALPFIQIIEEFEQKHLIEHRRKLNTINDLKTMLH